jgi:hypothetical protein
MLGIRFWTDVIYYLVLLAIVVLDKGGIMSLGADNEFYQS